MSSKAGKMSREIQNRRLNTLVQVLCLMEEEAKKKNFFQRVSIALRYVFAKDFKGFFND